MIKNGVDALIIEGSEAGGHIGPVSTSVLTQEILPDFRNASVPVFVAGGIGRGEQLASYINMGACGCQLGTLFACATESIAHQDFKKKFFRSSARNAVVSVQISPNFPVIPVRAIANKSTEAFAIRQREVIQKYERKELSKNDAQLEIEHFWVGSLKKAVIEGDVEHGSVMAGQSVGFVKEEKPAADILASLLEQCESLFSAS